MEEINGQDICVILSLKQGRNFGHLNVTPSEGIFIEATLNGAILDTDVVQITEKPIFDSELMWELDKKMLKRLRSGRAAIKVQCFAVNHIHRGRNHIGNFVMSLRQAHFVPSGKSYADVGESWSEWHKLHGAKPPCPELLCSLRVEGTPKMLEEDIRTKSSRQKQPKTQPSYQNPSTQWHSDKGIIQIGSDETATDNFLLIVYVGQAVNLDLLLPENYNVETATENEQLYFHYSIMEYSINTAKIPMSDMYKPVPLNEKMVVSLCSSMENLQKCFSTSSKLIIKLMIGQDDIGFTEMSMQGLVPKTNTTVFCSLDKDNSLMIESPCFLKGSKTGEVPTSPSGMQPCINIRIMLRYQGKEQKDIGQGEGQFEDLQNEPARLIRSSSYTVLDTPTERIYSVPSVDMEDSGGNNTELTVDTETQHGANVEVCDIVKQGTNKNIDHKLASGDVSEVGNMSQSLNESKQTSAQNKISASASQFILPCSWTISKNYNSEYILHDSRTKEPEGIYDPYHIFNLEITVQSVAFQRLITQKRCYFRFHHPKAEKISNPHPEIAIKEPHKGIQLQDIKCKLTFVSNPKEIKNLLLVCPPMISMCNTVEGQSKQLAVATINIDPLLEKEMKQCHYNTPLIDLKTVEQVGILGIRLSLDDLGPRQSEDKALLSANAEQKFGSAAFDDHIAFKIAEELEDWKERQQELFKAKLKKKEQAHLSALTEEWKKKCVEMETKLNHSVEECHRLAQSLSDTTDELRLKICKNVEREQELSRYKEITEQEYKLKVLEMKKSFRRTEDDLSLKKSSEEKLESALKSKSFFKEQWANAVREINHIKNEHQQHVQIQIKHNKEELKDISLQNLLGESEKEMKEDQSVIQQLRTEMNTIKSHGGLGDACQQYSEFLNPHVPPQHCPSNTISMHSKKPSSNTNLNRPSSLQQEGHELQLKALIEERDVLLNTGTYSLEDPVIAKLNHEIRTLLSNGIT
ncbi:centrosomal protein of 120 kDa isoform X3 [Cryptotermes secundus]|uniref:centrosomal protein of 120 kDa isoform X3 n=1 Tax=Cryptotermes secundus TaxID=105785 RepID=UPI000CD7D6A9|nr:centrosomal protein of 120 kDa isoform X3 [Cryptotermes secundus]